MQNTAPKHRTRTTRSNHTQRKHTDDPSHQQRQQRNQQTETQAEAEGLSRAMDRQVVHHPEMVQKQRNTERQLKTSADPSPYLDFVAKLAGRSDDYRIRVIIEPS